MADAEATLARERTIRDGMSLERKKLDGEKQVHLLRAMIIAGDLKPPVVAADSRSPIVRACPSWGIRRVWRLWGRRPREMPWYDEGVGSRMQTTTNEVYKLRDADLERRILVQDRRIEEATKYLELVKKLGDGA